MPVAEWDSYIVQWRYLIQYLIGHIDTDADLIAHLLRMTRGDRCDTAGSDQVFIIKMQRIPRQNMSLYLTNRVCQRGCGQWSTVDTVGVNEQILQAGMAQTLQRILLLPLIMPDQHHPVRWLSIHYRIKCDGGRREVHIERTRHVAIFAFKIQPVNPVTRHGCLIAKLAGAGNAALPVPAIANAINIDPIK